MELPSAEAQGKRIAAAQAKAELGIADVREKRRLNALAALTPQETKALDRVVKMQASKLKAEQKVTKWKDEVKTLTGTMGVAEGVVQNRKATLNGIV